MTQEQHILKHLRRHGSITPLEALSEYGCFRLSARCFDLKQAGYSIETDLIKHNGKRFAKYSLTH